MGCLRIVSRKQALKLILDSTHVLKTIKLPLEKTLGYVASEDIYASADVPRFDRAAMDGYAIYSKDTVNATKEHPVKLKVVGKILPSMAKLAPIESGQAVRIRTGGAIPPGADAVIKEEDTRSSGETIEVPAAIRPCQYVWEKGKDVKDKSLIVERGAPITPAVLGVLARLQVREVPVTRRPEVCILAVGNELVDIHDKLRDHKIVASNIYTLSAMIKECGSMLGWAKISRDDKGAIRSHVEKAFNSDVLITTGGSSNADSDLAHALMKEIGVDIKFGGVSMVPGKGTSFGLYDNKLIFSLPGTPSAVYVSFYTLVLPALLRLKGLRVNAMPPVQAILEQDIWKKPGTEHLVQGLVRGNDSPCSVLPLAGPDVEVFSAMKMANGLIIVDPDRNHLSQGQTVSVILLNPSDDLLPERAVSQHNPIRPREAGMPPIVSIVGKSDAGKTTLLERLVPELKQRGYRIGTIKHDVHGFDIDHEGKDSWRHKHAGAQTVVISSPRKVAVIKDVETEETIDALAKKYFQDVDIILTEGYKREDKPKIEVFRSKMHDKPLCKEDGRLVAMVSDIPLDLGVPRFDLDNINGLADLIEQRFLVTVHGFNSSGVQGSPKSEPSCELS
jgi:molybdopterin-guanine dinucleotide biosynthesis protein MobB